MTHARTLRRSFSRSLGSALRPLALAVAAGAVTTASLACSSSGSDPAPAAPAAPVVDGLPASLAIYDGKTVALPFTVRTSDPTKVTVSVTSDAALASLDPPDAAAAATPAPDGLYHGTLRLRPGYALEAGQGTNVALDVVDGTAQHASVSVALDVHKLGWQRRLAWISPAGPQTREHGSFFYDADEGSAYLFGGSGYHPQNLPIDDSWRLDIAKGTWSPWTPRGDVPAAAGSRRVAAVPGTKKFFMYGGYVGAAATAADDADLYAVTMGSGTVSFQRLVSKGDATARELHAFAYDPKSDQLAVFGGYATALGQVLADTWLVKVSGTTATWTELKGTGPSGRYGSFTAYDADSRRLVVWSGAQDPVDPTADPIHAAQDAWALDFSKTPPAWTKLAPTGTAPKGRRNGCSMPDPSGRRLFVYGGTSDGATTEKGLFVLDLEPGHEAWTRLDLANPPPIRSSGFGFATADGAVTCGFGNDRSPYDDVTFLGYGAGP